MIDLVLLALLAKAGAAYAPPPELFYHQAVACAASAMAERDGSKSQSKSEPSSEQFGEAMTWGMILAETGRKIGRTRAQVDSGDIETAEAFYRRLKRTKPTAFAAHRTYCRALLSADRP
jgi:hypothetical protein